MLHLGASSLLACFYLLFGDQRTADKPGLKQSFNVER